jgi:hypothetical protein
VQAYSLNLEGSIDKCRVAWAEPKPGKLVHVVSAGKWGRQLKQNRGKVK